MFDTLIAFRLPQRQNAKLEKVAKELETSKSALLRQAVEIIVGEKESKGGKK